MYIYIYIYIYMVFNRGEICEIVLIGTEKLGYTHV